MASREGNRIISNDSDVTEGVESLTVYKGSARDILQRLAGGVRHGFGYCGAKNIKDLQQTAEFIKVSQAGMRESMPHEVVVDEEFC